MSQQQNAQHIAQVLQFDSVLAALQYAIKVCSDNLGGNVAPPSMAMTVELTRTIELCAGAAADLARLQRAVSDVVYGLSEQVNNQRKEIAQLRQTCAALEDDLNAPQPVVHTGAFYDHTQDALQAVQDIRDRTPSAQTYTHSRLNLIGDLLGKLVPDTLPGSTAEQDPQAAVVNADLRTQTLESVVAEEVAAAGLQIPMVEGVVRADEQLAWTGHAICEHFAPGAGNHVMVGIVDAKGHLHWTLAGEITAGGFSSMRQRLHSFADSPSAVDLCSQARA